MIKYINYKGKKHPVSICFYALVNAGLFNTDKFSDPSKLTWKEYQDLCYYSLKMGYMTEGKEIPLTEEDVCKYLNENFMEFMKFLPEFFTVLFSKEMEQLSTEGESPKKMPKKKT